MRSHGAFCQPLCVTKRSLSILTQIKMIAIICLARTLKLLELVPVLLVILLASQGK